MSRLICLTQVHFTSNLTEINVSYCLEFTCDKHWHRMPYDLVAFRYYSNAKLSFEQHVIFVHISHCQTKTRIRGISQHLSQFMRQSVIQHGYHATVCMPGCQPNHGFFFNCTTMGQASDLMTALT